MTIIKKLKNNTISRPRKPMRPPRRCSPRTPVLTLSSRAWLKLQYLCHAAETEVGGFGLSNKDDLLYIEDIATVKQHCSVVSVEFDDAAVADYFDEQIEQGRKPEQFARHWIHTHPGDSAAPSALDEETFTRVFGRCNWAVMLILACGGETYCRLRVNSHVAEGSDVRSPLALSSVIPVHVDYASLLDELDEINVEAWAKELKANVRQAKDGLLFRDAAMDGLEADMDLRELDLDAFDLDEMMMEGLDPTDEANWPECQQDREVDHDASD